MPHKPTAYETDKMFRPRNDSTSARASHNPGSSHSVLRLVRHEATDRPVMTNLLRYNPPCDHRYPTGTCTWSNPAVRSSRDNVHHTTKRH